MTGPELEAERDETRESAPGRRAYDAADWDRHQQVADETDWDRYHEVDPPEHPWPASVTRWLLENEYPLLATRKHEARLIPALAVLLAALAAAIAANAELYYHHAASPAHVHVVWWSFLAAAAYAAWRWLDWRSTWIIVTPRRVISVYGVFRRVCEQLPVTKLRDADLTQGFWGRIFGYATFEFSSIATGHSLQEVTYVPLPVETHREITRLITRPVTP